MTRYTWAELSAQRWGPMLGKPLPPPPPPRAGPREPGDDDDQEPGRAWLDEFNRLIRRPSP